MVEVVGDSSRDGRWALVRLAVEEDRIVSAEAEGLERPLEGLTLLDAAAVGGDELAVDALANAIGPVFRAAPSPARTAVAMSGGVDSAVALLRAGPDAVGVTLRLWLDPKGPDAERACCSPEAVLAARATCHALGLPHARLDPRLLERIWFPLGEQTKEETRAEAAAAGLPVAGRSESQEACFLAGGDYRDFLERHGLSADEGVVVDETGRELGRHSGFWRFTPGQRRGLGVSSGEPLYALRSDPETNVVVVGPRRALATHEIEARGRLYVPVERAEVKPRYRSPALPADVVPTGSGFRVHIDQPAFGAATGQAAVLYEDDVVVGAGTIETSESARTFQLNGT